MESQYPSGPGPVEGLVYVAIFALLVASVWKTFVKAGLPGWGVLVPFYNVYLLVKLAGRPGWWLILLFIPLANVVVDVVLCTDIARRFGKGTGFAVGLFFLPFVFFPILAFGDARYSGATTATA
jgi:uncharacterized protein DUF5684